MRIAFDAKRLFNNNTGLGNYSRTIVRGLREAFPDNDYLLFTPRANESSLTHTFLHDDRYEVFTPKRKFLSSFWRTFSMGKAAARAGADIFHGLSHELPTGLRSRGVHSVLTVHDVAFKTFTDMYHWHDRQIYDMKLRHACRQAEAIVAISESTKRDVMRFYHVDEKKIQVIYQPVQDIFYTPFTQEEAREMIHEQLPALPDDFMLYVGSINSRKNLMGIVQAMEGMSADLIPPLVIVGRGGGYKEKVSGYISSHRLDNRFIWMENLSDNQLLKALYTCAHLFLYPSFYEGFGLPVVEAQLSGCPVLTSQVSSLPEAGGDAALLVNPRSPDDIRSGIERFFSDSNLRQDMVQQGRHHAETMFNPVELARQMMSLYQKLAIRQD